jgi:hypothetical protein
MIVLNLACAHDHHFEGWFGSAADFEAQLARELVTCPLCANSHIKRMPTAARLNVSHLRNAQAAPAETDASAAAAVAVSSPTSKAQGLMLQALQQVLAQTEDVGPRFVEEARRIHYGETEQRPIRGQASPADAVALAEEGIAVLALNLPASLKGTLQ